MQAHLASVLRDAMRGRPVVVTGSNGESKSAMMCQAAQRFVAAAPDGAVCIVRLCGVTELR